MMMNQASSVGTPLTASYPDGEPRPAGQPLLSPERASENARALLAGTGVESRGCENPPCGRPVRGRASKRWCSGKCRAAASRQRQSDARAQRDTKLLTLVSEVFGRLEEIRQLLNGAT